MPLSHPMEACAYPGCCKLVVVGKLSCIMHWFLCPPNVREAMWRLYRQKLLGDRRAEPVVFGSHGRLSIRSIAQAHWAYAGDGEEAIGDAFRHLGGAIYHRQRAIAGGERDPFEGFQPIDVLFDVEALGEVTIGSSAPQVSEVR
jgi:hypothetical protein